MTLTRRIHAASLAHQKMVSMVVRMVNELGITSLAEGIEYPDDLTVLTEMGFHLGQGYHLGRPAPICQVLP